MKNNDTYTTGSRAAGSLGRIFWGVTACALTTIGTYFALTVGLAWLVFLLFGLGLLYVLWSAIEALLSGGAPGTIAEISNAAEEPAVEVPAELVQIRSRVMNEVIWGNFDPATKALAEGLAGPSAPFVEHYIELRVAQLRGGDAREEGSAPSVEERSL